MNKFSKAIFCIILWAIGLGLIGYFSQWQISLGVFICLWANILESKS